MIKRFDDYATEHDPDLNPEVSSPYEIRHCLGMKAKYERWMTQYPEFAEKEKKTRDGRFPQYNKMTLRRYIELVEDELKNHPDKYR